MADRHVLTLVDSILDSILDPGSTRSHACDVRSLERYWDIRGRECLAEWIFRVPRFLEAGSLMLANPIVRERNLPGLRLMGLAGRILTAPIIPSSLVLSGTDLGHLQSALELATITLDLVWDHLDRRIPQTLTDVFDFLSLLARIAKTFDALPVAVIMVQDRWPERFEQLRVAYAREPWENMDEPTREDRLADIGQSLRFVITHIQCHLETIQQQNRPLYNTLMRPYRTVVNDFSIWMQRTVEAVQQTQDV